MSKASRCSSVQSGKGNKVDRLSEVLFAGLVVRNVFETGEFNEYEGFRLQSRMLSSRVGFKRRGCTE